ncbi:hypothetical protein A2U01_0005317, partial [Trifolium medium]|nr:hypothetical protein [Trifolium medium]
MTWSSSTWHAGGDVDGQVELDMLKAGAALRVAGCPK